MIRIQRLSAPGVLTTPQFRGTREINSGPKETADAEAFYRTRANRNKSFSFKMYKHPDVRRRLEEMAATKCAYCESKVLAITDGDIEHWRPKAEIDTDNGETLRPGYYWLAAKWENLLLSCPRCNQPRTYRLLPDSSDATTLGKGNQFPLAEGSDHATQPGQESAEKPLLLNPCSTRPADDPARHLEFRLETGDAAGVVAAKRRRNGGPSPMGEASIQVYALNRPELVSTRREHLKRVQKTLTQISKLVSRLDENLNNHEAEQDLREARDELADLLRPTQPYLQMVRQAIAKFERETGLPVLGGG